MSLLPTLILIPLLFSQQGYTDRPCAARSVPGQSVVCVCNATYCDDVTRVIPSRESYIAYTSSKAGSRFRKRKGKIEEVPSQSKCCPMMLKLDLERKYQRVEGFGAAVTDAAGINWLSLDEQTRKHLIYSYFSESGLQYNMVRVPIGGSDFSTRPYSYNELPENDPTLSNYTLTQEDFEYKAR